MLRTLFIAVFLSLYILILGPPLLLYTLVTRHIDPLYWAGLKGVMFFVRAVGVRVRVEGKTKIPALVCLFLANHTSSADAPAVVGAIPRRIAVLLKESLFKWPIVGQAFTLARFIPVNRKDRESAIASVEKAAEAMRKGQSFLIYVAERFGPEKVFDLMDNWYRADDFETATGEGVYVTSRSAADVENAITATDR